MTPPRGKRHRSAAIIRSTDLGFPPEVAESDLELLHGDAFKKGTTQTAPPSPAFAVVKSKFSLRSVRRNFISCTGRRVLRRPRERDPMIRRHRRRQKDPPPDRHP